MPNIRGGIGAATGCALLVCAHAYAASELEQSKPFKGRIDNPQASVSASFGSQVEPHAKGASTVTLEDHVCNEFKRDKSKTLVFTCGSAGFTTWKASPVRPGWCLVLTRSGIPDYEPDGNANLEYTTRNLSLPAATYRQRQSVFEKFVGKVATTLRLGDLTPTTGGTSMTISAYIDRNKGEASQTIVAPASLGTYIIPLPKSLSRDAEERLIKEASRSAGVEVLPVEEVVKRMPHENDKTDNETPKVRAWLTSQGSTRLGRLSSTRLWNRESSG